MDASAHMAFSDASLTTNSSSLAALGDCLHQTQRLDAAANLTGFGQILGIGSFYSQLLTAASTNSALAASLSAVALEDFLLVEKHCLPAALLALTLKVEASLEELHHKMTRTLTFLPESWAVQERLWWDVYLPRRPNDAAFKEATWQPWASSLLQREASILAYWQQLSAMRTPRQVPLQPYLSYSSSSIRSQAPGSDCVIRTARMAVYESKANHPSESKLFFYGQFLNAASNVLMQWRSLSTIPASSPLLTQALEILYTLQWTWCHCAQAVFLALLLHIVWPLEQATAELLSGKPFVQWRPILRDAHEAANLLFFPLRDILIEHWNAWGSRIPSWVEVLRRAENRVMFYWDVMKSQDVDRVADRQEQCAIGAKSTDGSIIRSCAQDHGLIKAEAFDQQMEKMFLLVSAALMDLGVEFWPIGGTLIGALRYGRIAGQLLGSKMDSIDDDLEFMVGVSSEEQWQDLAPELEERLLKAGFGICYLQISEPSDAYRHRLRADTLTCGMFQPYAIAVELRSYIIADAFLFQHALRDLPGCADVEQRHWPDPPPSFLCFAYEIPYFQQWRGQLPTQLIYPLKACSLFNRTIWCPAQPMEVLRGWNGGEYDLPGYCLAVPLLMQDRTHRDPRNSALSRIGLGDADLKLLRHYAKDLNSKGFASFLPEWSTGSCPELVELARRWANGVCPRARYARPQDLT